MATVTVRHKVADIGKWKDGHQDRLAIFAPAISSYQAFQDSGDPNSVVLVIEVNNLELLGAIIHDPKNQHLKDKHTVLEPIIISLPITF